MTRAGAHARSLLGGDESLHVFSNTKAAAEYCARIPGARVYAPRHNGWAGALNDAITGVIRARDQHVNIELNATREPKAASLALEIAIALYDRGAYEVSIAGNVVRAPERHQTYRGQR